jgi:membrane protein implicated in regulation of membrane protease activity
VLLIFVALIASLLIVLVLPAIFYKEPEDRVRPLGMLLAIWILMVGSLLTVGAIYILSFGILAFGGKGLGTVVLQYKDSPFLFVALVPVFLALPVLTLIGGYRLLRYFRNQSKGPNRSAHRTAFGVRWPLR